MVFIDLAKTIIRYLEYDVVTFKKELKLLTEKVF